MRSRHGSSVHFAQATSSFSARVNIRVRVKVGLRLRLRLGLVLFEVEANSFSQRDGECTSTILCISYFPPTSMLIYLPNR